MLPPGRPRSASSSTRGAGLEAVGAVAVAQQHVLDGFGQHRVERVEGARQRQVLGGVVLLGGATEQPCREVQAEQGQRLRVRGRELGAEDRAVGQAVAVDLARRQLRHAPGCRGGIRVLELGVALVDVEGAGERAGRVGRGVAQPGQPREQHVDLELRTLGVCLGHDGCCAGRLEEAVEDGRGARRRGWSSPSPSHPPRSPPRRGRPPSTLVPVRISAPAATAARARPSVTAPMPADGDVPVAGPATDEVVEEAHVLAQVLAAQVGEGADRARRSPRSRAPCRPRRSPRAPRLGGGAPRTPTARRPRRGRRRSSSARNGSSTVGKTFSAGAARGRRSRSTRRAPPSAR